MRRRITLAVVVVAVAAVVLTGIGTTLLSWRHARTDATEQLRDEAAAIVPFVTGAAAGPRVDGATATGRLTRRVRVARRALRLVDASVLVVDRSGLIASGDIPEGVDHGAVTAVAAAGGAESGIDGRLAWAVTASDKRPGGRRIVVVLTREVSPFPGALRWLALSGVVAVVLAIVAAEVVARRLAAPLQRVERTTRRIAQGDLDARVGELPHGVGAETVRLADSVDSMASSLQEARGTQRNFLMSISHDLRTPLTALRGYAEAIVDGAVEDPRVAAAVIVDQSDRLERLVADLLDLARMESDQFTLARDAVDVVAVARASLAAFGPQSASWGVSTQLRATHGEAVVTGDADRLGQVFANLIENALRFAAHSVLVEVTVQDRRVVAAVHDDGPGISVEDLPRVFDRLFTSRSTPHAADRPGGSGLGLAICRELVEAMGGTIVASRPPEGIGTVVTVTFPRRVPPPGG